MTDPNLKQNAGYKEIYSLVRMGEDPFLVLDWNQPEYEYSAERCTAAIHALNILLEKSERAGAPLEVIDQRLGRVMDFMQRVYEIVQHRNPQREFAWSVLVNNRHVQVWTESFLRHMLQTFQFDQEQIEGTVRRLKNNPPSIRKRIMNFDTALHQATEVEDPSTYYARQRTAFVRDPQLDAYLQHQRHPNRAVAVEISDAHANQLLAAGAHQVHATFVHPPPPFTGDGGGANVQEEARLAADKALRNQAEANRAAAEAQREEEATRRRKEEADADAREGRRLAAIAAQQAAAAAADAAAAEAKAAAAANLAEEHRDAQRSITRQWQIEGVRMEADRRAWRAAEAKEAEAEEAAKAADRAAASEAEAQIAAREAATAAATLQSMASEAKEKLAVAEKKVDKTAAVASDAAVNVTAAIEQERAVSGGGKKGGKRSRSAAAAAAAPAAAMAEAANDPAQATRRRSSREPKPREIFDPSAGTTARWPFFYE